MFSDGGHGSKKDRGVWGEMGGTHPYYITPAYFSSDYGLSKIPQIGDIRMNGYVPSIEV